MESIQKEEGFSEEGSIGKCCSDCKTRKTPLWRSGPSGPKSLCNACGIRYKKKPDTKAKKNTKMKRGSEANLMGARRQWSEVERAALLLMALSCGAVFS